MFCSDFRERHTQVIDEVWYQRAVDLQDKSGTFVYSVPFSDGGGESLGIVAVACFTWSMERNIIEIKCYG
jgi:hypothetical protein